MFDKYTHKILENLSDCLACLPSSNEHSSFLILDQFGCPVVQGSLHTLVLRLSDVTREDFII